MSEVVIYATGMCPYCIRAKMLLDDKGVAYTEIRLDLEPGRRAEMEQRSGRTSVPQIFVGARHVGGCDDLYALERLDELNGLLGETAAL